jgi:hypothetical protein
MQWTGSFLRRSKEPEAGQGAGHAPPSVSPELVASILSSSLSDAVHAAAEAAANTAHLGGVAEPACEQIFNAAVAAATAALEASPGLRAAAAGDPAAAAAVGAPPLLRQPSRTSRLEGTLARAIKKKAIRVMDLFQDWDEDKDGLITKRELRVAIQATGLEATNEEIDALFSKCTHPLPTRFLPPP